LYPVEVSHDRRFVRRRDAQSGEMPIKLTRFRVRHSTHELFEISYFEWNVNRVEVRGCESGVMNARRQGMRDRLTNDADYFRLLIDLIDAIQLAQILRGKLAGS